VSDALAGGAGASGMVGEQPDDGVGPTSGAVPQVAAALACLDDLEQQPVGQHVQVFDEAHRLLQDALATLDGG
jgi:hypothetical protein